MSVIRSCVTQNIVTVTINRTKLRFDILKIHQDIDENVQF